MHLKLGILTLLFVVAYGDFDEGLPYSLVSQILGFFDAVFLMLDVRSVACYRALIS